MRRMQKAGGLWRDGDLPNFQAARRAWDRTAGEGAGTETLRFLSITCKVSEQRTTICIQIRDDSMKVYLDNCCFNRPFDDQSQIRVRIETEAKLKIQEEIRSGKFHLVWSYILDYENHKNPFVERKAQIISWKKYAEDDIEESIAVLEAAYSLSQYGIQRIDSLHIACAIIANCDYFLSTDDKILGKSGKIMNIKINDPIGFIKEVLS